VAVDDVLGMVVDGDDRDVVSDAHRAPHLVHVLDVRHGAGR
jgi:hypothetical protein